MTLSDLQQKDIINMMDGKKLGRIIDAEINEEGKILYFVIEPRRLFHFFRLKEEQKITFQQIKKIGEDVILVEYITLAN